MAKLNHEKHRHNGKPTLSAPAAVPQPSAAPVVRQSARPTQPDRFPFGKYNSQTIAHAEASEPTYLDWLMLQEWFPQRFPDLARNVQIAISTREEAVTPVPDWGRSKIVAAAISAALTGAEHKKVVKKRKKRGSGADNVVQLRPMVTKIAGRAEKDALREGIAARKVGKPCVSPYTLPDGSPILLLRACHAAWQRGWEAGA